MDLSEEFVEMCKKSEEIQNLRPVGKYFIEGDVYTDLARPRTFYTSTNSQKRYDFDIWIPRVDQLIDSIQYSKKNDSRSLFNYLHSASYGLQGFKEANCEIFQTVERHLLCFVMKESFGKYWDLEELNWYDVNKTVEDNSVKIFDTQKSVWVEKNTECLPEREI